LTSAEFCHNHSIVLDITHNFLDTLHSVMYTPTNVLATLNSVLDTLDSVVGTLGIGLDILGNVLDAVDRVVDTRDARWRATDEGSALTDSERRGNNLKGFKDVDLEAKARIWP